MQADSLPAELPGKPRDDVMKSYYLGVLDKGDLAMRKSDIILCFRSLLIVLDRASGYKGDMYAN